MSEPLQEYSNDESQCVVFSQVLKGENHSISLDVIKSKIIKEKDELLEYCLILNITLEQYNYILENNLFKLKSGIINSASKVDFHPDFEITLELAIAPNFLIELNKSELIDQINSIPFAKINQELPTHNFFLAENWLAICAQQNQDTHQVECKTLWSKLRPQDFRNAAKTGSNEKISETLTDFFAAWTQSNLSNLSNSSSSSNSSSTRPKTKASPPFDGLTKLVDNFTDVALKAVTKAINEGEFLLKNVIAFLEKDTWAFEQLPNQPSLRLRYQGQDWPWNCYVTVDETNKTVVFYSVCPILTPEPRRAVVAEFLTRVNYGLLIGNFEINYIDGEVRYKTSINVEGSLLSQALIKQLIYTNVLTMDQHSVALKAVIEQGMNAEAAILLIAP